MDMVEKKEELLLSYLGEEEMLLALTRAMSYSEKDDYYSYLMRVYDIQEPKEKGNE